MNNIIPEPLRVILKDFCHVEWYEVNELAAAIKQGTLRLNAGSFEDQLNELLLSSTIPLKEINSLTGNEFESSKEAKEWLADIKKQVFHR